MLRRLALLLVLSAVPAPALAADAFGDDVARVAARFRDERPRLRIEACNGLIEDILRDAGVPIRGNVRTLWATMKERGWVHRRKVPFPGDVVFFDRTYDSNGNGRQDDRLSHVAVVIRVDDDGTAHMVHRGSRGIRPLTMNLRQPSARRDASGKVVNSWLGQPGYAKDGAKLAGELWRAFATPEPEGRTAPSRAVVAQARDADRVDAMVRAVRTPDRRTATEAGPLLTEDDTGWKRAWKGRRLRARHLDGRSCRELWFLRNTLFARHGYSFRHPDTIAAFALVADYERDPAVHRDTAARHLSRRDRKNLDAILERERRCR